MKGIISNITKRIIRTIKATQKPKMILVSFIALTVMPAMLLSGCDDAENTHSTDYPCRFTFDMSLHQTSVLTRIIDNPGLYVGVSSRKVKGVTWLTIEPNNGDKEDFPLTTERENYYSYDNMGAGNSLIVGCSNFNGLKAYDRQCPSCLKSSRNPVYTLAFTGNRQKMECKACGRIYELETGQSNDGVRLMEYTPRVSGSILTVTNL